MAIVAAGAPGDRRKRTGSAAFKPGTAYTLFGYIRTIRYIRLMMVDAFVEDAGLFYERLGLSRTAGRVMGWLLVAETGDADAPELAEALAVAKSSMSVALRQLEQAGLVERFRVRGGRRDRYRLAEDVFARAFRAKMAEFEGFRALAEQGLQAVGDDPERRRRLELMRDMYAFMMDRFPRLLQEWDELKDRR
ncbi:MarR family transcriptional regulator [Streptosporangium sp. NPDC049304]|uniref:GbsR/MarR family transcriptional regulator n=2 Tax=Streptosporangium TaxID=2000 RepID=UPI003445F05F